MRGARGFGTAGPSRKIRKTAPSGQTTWLVWLIAAEVPPGMPYTSTPPALCGISAT
jgi:hypothetical protein